MLQGLSQRNAFHGVASHFIFFHRKQRRRLHWRPSTQRPCDRANQKQHNEHKKQNLGYTRKARGNPAETEYGGNQRQQQKCYG